MKNLLFKGANSMFRTTEAAEPGTERASKGWETLSNLCSWPWAKKDTKPRDKLLGPDINVMVTLFCNASTC